MYPLKYIEFFLYYRMYLNIHFAMRLLTMLTSLKEYVLCVLKCKQTGEHQSLPN